VASYGPRSIFADQRARFRGALVQVELDALDPDDLRALYAAAIADYWDTDAYRAVLEREARERDRLTLPDVSGSVSGDARKA
jgi:hypothetical protein